jgi:hypothetical protein
MHVGRYSVTRQHVLFRVVRVVCVREWVWVSNGCVTTLHSAGMDAERRGARRDGTELHLRPYIH